MRVFVTGATGLVGSAVIRELRQGGHTVLGLARSDASAAKLDALGVDVHRGELSDVDSLAAGAAQADAVVHTAFVHDFDDFPAAIETDRVAIVALGGALVGSDKRLVITSGTPAAENGVASTEHTVPAPDSMSSARFANEDHALAFADRGVRVSVVRIPRSVHGESDQHGFVPQLIATARDAGFAGYVGTGEGNWSSVHQLDAARLYRLAVEQGHRNARLHAVTDSAVPIRVLAETIGARLDLPVRSVPSDEAMAHFGFVGMILSADHATTAAQTQRLLGWQPEQRGLLAELADDHYFRVPDYANR